MTILIKLSLLFLWCFDYMEIIFLVYYPIWTLVWKKKYEKVGKRFHRLIKLEQTDKLAKSTSWKEITVKFWRPGEKSWKNLVLNKPINQADKPNIMDVPLILGSNLDLNNPIHQVDKPNIRDVTLILGSNLVLNKPINQADKPNIRDFALILGTKKDNQASVKSRDVSLKVSGFSLKNEETPGFPPNFP